MRVVSEVSVVTIKPKFGLFAFANFLIFDSFYVAEVGVYSRPTGGMMLVYPRKKNRDICYPIKADLGKMIEEAVESHMEEYGLI